MSPVQFEQVLRTVVVDELDKRFEMRFEKYFNELAGHIAELTFKVDSFLTKEWSIHKHIEHPAIETQLNSIEKSLKVKPA